MATKKDYYEILGIAKNATFDDIKKAYRSAALRYHPDRVPEEQKKEAEEKFKEISEAYAILSDPQKRAIYDQRGHAGIDQQYSNEDIFRGADFSSIFEDLSEFGFGEDLFEQFLGRRGGRKVQSRAHDLQVTVEISLEEAATGVDKTITIPRRDPCPTCGGTGAAPGSQKIVCPRCGGRGQIAIARGNVRMMQTCPECHGEGAINKNPCPECHGEGTIAVKRKLRVTIPPGVDTGSQLRVRGEGEGGQADLYVIIEVRPHPLFERHGDDLHTKVTIPLSMAVLGGETYVPTLTGRVSMKIPPGTQNGKLFRLRGKGMPNFRTRENGDEIVQINVHIPTILTSEQRRLMEEFAKLEHS